MDYEINLAKNDNKEWRNILERELKSAKTFEIHCWNEETKEIKMAIQFGKIIDHNWSYGKVIKGKVTTDFIEYILNLNKPNDVEIYNKMTPFFSIILDNGFSSEHYGTELHKTNNN